MEKEKTYKETKEGETDQVKKVLVNGVDVGWHTGDKFRNRLKQFHDNYALQPDRTEVNVIQTFLEPALRKKLSKTNFPCKTIEYTGSSFEGTKVPKAVDDPDFEFDMLFIIKGGDQLKKVVDFDPDIPGFVFLEPRDQNIHEHCFEKQLVTRSDKRRTLSADKFLSNFHSVLAKCINEIGDIRGMVEETDLHMPTDYLINLRRHGPAIQMDVYPNTTPNAAAEDEVLGDWGQKEVEYNDGVTEGRPTVGDGDNEQCNRIDDKWKGGLEGEKAESGTFKENDRSMNKIKNTNEDSDEEDIFETEEESDTESDQGDLEEKGRPKGNRQEVEVCVKFCLATKSVIGKKELKKLYSVDVVPTLHVPSIDHNTEGEYYVAKPVKGHDDRIEELRSAWRRSFSLEAKKKLKFAENEKTCKRMVFRILKAMRNREPGLDKLNTYHLKNALLKELHGTEIDEVYWSKKSLAERFKNLLDRLIKDYSPGQQMSEYFITDIDLLQHMKEATRENIHCRLKRLRNSETEMMKILALRNSETQRTRILEGRNPRKRQPRKKQTNTEQAEGLSAGM